jgi:hypothetical protein
MSMKNWLHGARITKGYHFDGPRADARKTDKKVKYCCECDRCWIYNEFSIPKKYEPEYYVDFPAYGKQVEMCPNCE